MYFVVLFQERVVMSNVLCVIVDVMEADTHYTTPSSILRMESEDPEPISNIAPIFLPVSRSPVRKRSRWCLRNLPVAVLLNVASSSLPQNCCGSSC